MIDPNKPRQDSETPFRHWEKGSNGSPVQVQSTTPMNNEQQLLNDKKVFAQSLPIDQLAEYKAAIASGDPQKMAAFREHLNPAQLKMLNEIEARDPMTMVKGLANTAMLIGGIEIAQNPKAFLDGLLGNGVVGRQSSITAATAPVTGAPGLGLETDLKLPKPVLPGLEI